MGARFRWKKGLGMIVVALKTFWLTAGYLAQVLFDALLDFFFDHFDPPQRLRLQLLDALLAACLSPAYSSGPGRAAPCPT